MDQLNGWFGNGHAGIGIITGAASGNVEMLEFEGCAVAEGVLTSWGELMDAPGLGDIKPRLMTGYVDATPTGVLHLHYRIDGKPVPGNTKLARRPVRVSLRSTVRTMLSSSGFRVAPAGVPNPAGGRVPVSLSPTPRSPVSLLPGLS